MPGRAEAVDIKFRSAMLNDGTLLSLRATISTSGVRISDMGDIDEWLAHFTFPEMSEETANAVRCVCLAYDVIFEKGHIFADRLQERDWSLCYAAMRVAAACLAASAVGYCCESPQFLEMLKTEGVERFAVVLEKAKDGSEVAVAGI